MNLFKNVSVREVGAPVAAAANTDSNSDRIDMQGYEGVMFVCPLTDSVNTGVATLKVEQNTADSDSGMAALSGASAAATSAADDDLNNLLLVVDVYRPTERYVQAVRTSGTANIAFGTLTAILYGAKELPVAAHSTVLASAVVASPAE
jgi:cystathionine beta-lyase/cystathionine gamma-synthase